MNEYVNECLSECVRVTGVGVGDSPSQTSVAWKAVQSAPSQSHVTERTDTPSGEKRCHRGV